MSGDLVEALEKEGKTAPVPIGACLPLNKNRVELLSIRGSELSGTVPLEVTSGTRVELTNGLRSPSSSMGLPSGTGTRAVSRTSGHIRAPRAASCSKPGKDIGDIEYNALLITVLSYVLPSQSLAVILDPRVFALQWAPLGRVSNSL